MWVIITSILWMGLGWLACRFLPMPQRLPQFLSQSLYWIGIPLQILALARRASLSHSLWLPVLSTIVALFMGIGLSVLSLEVLWCFAIYNHNQTKLHPCLRTPGSEDNTVINLPLSHIIPQKRSEEGSFILGAMMSNAGYIGLAIAPVFINQSYWSWIAIYHVVNNLLGFFVLGVFLASFFGHPRQNSLWPLLRNLLLVPAVWAFVIGWYTREFYLPQFIETSLQASRWVVNFSAFLLTGLQLSKLRNFNGLQKSLLPSILKVILLPAVIGVGLTLFGMSGDARFSMVLMSGTPTAFTAIILAEKYNLDRQTTANSILVSTLIFPIAVLLWVSLFKCTTSSLCPECTPGF